MSGWSEFKKSGSVGGDKPSRISLLVVDDEDDIVKSIAAVFEGRFEVFQANTPADALRLFREHQPGIVISDQRMPGTTGIELFRTIKDINPDTVRILVTGYSDIDVVVTALNEGLVWRYVAKPWDHGVFKALVDEAARECGRRAGDPGPGRGGFLGN